MAHVSKVKYLGYSFYKYREFRFRVHPKSIDKMKRKLRSFNLPEWVVFEIANCRKGIWRPAVVLNRVLTNKRIASLGYLSLTDYYLQVCENY